MKFLLLLPAFLLALGLTMGMGYGDNPVKAEKKNDPPDMQALIQQLGAKSFDMREKAFHALKEAGEEIRPLLKKALESEDVEIRWRASRLLADLDGKKVDTRGLDKQPGKKLSDLKRRLQELQESLPEEALLFDDLFEHWPDRVPFSRDDDLFSRDPFSGKMDLFLDERPFGENRFSLDFFHDDLFKNMEEMMKELGQRQGDLRIEIGGQKGKYHMERRDDKGSEIRTLEIEEDGSIKATITRTDEAGETQQDIYEAESMEAFKESHPEVAESFSMESLSMGAPSLRFQWPPAIERSLPTPRVSPFADPGAQRRTLGIYVDPEGPDDVLRAHLGLAEDQGLVVRKVMSGSLAEKLGLKPHDVILSLNANTVGEADDIAMVLSSLKKGDEVKVIVLRDGKKITLAAKSEFQDRKPI